MIDGPYNVKTLNAYKQKFFAEVANRKTRKCMWEMTWGNKVRPEKFLIWYIYVTSFTLPPCAVLHLHSEV